MQNFRRYIYLIFSVLFFLLAVVQEHVTLQRNPELRLIESFRNTFVEQETKLDEYLNHAESKLTVNLPAKNYFLEYRELSKQFDLEGLSFVVFKGSELVYWSSSLIAFPNLKETLTSKNRLLVLPNGIYTFQKRTVGDQLLIGLVHLKTNYSYENQFLENKFVEPFHLPADFTITSSKDQNSLPIFDAANEYVFTVTPSGAKFASESQLYFPALLYLLGFLFLLVSLYQRIDLYQKVNFVVKISVFFLILLGIYAIHLYVKIPFVLSYFGIFGPQYYAGSAWIPSLGDLFLVASLFFFWSLVFAKELVKIERLGKFPAIGLYVFIVGLYQLVGLIIGDLIRNSNITFKLNQITDIDQFSVISYLAVAMLLFAVFLIHIKTIERSEAYLRKASFLKINAISILILIAGSIYSPSGWIFLLILFFAVNLIHRQVRKMHILPYSLAYSILFVSLFSLIALLIIYDSVKEHDLEVQKLWAVTLSSEQDPVTEVFLTRLQPRINNDTVIPKLLLPPYSELENYLGRTYFNGYFHKYDIQYWFCTSNDTVTIQPENIQVPCYPFFNQMILELGSKIAGSNFYFMNNMKGRVSYFGKFQYPKSAYENGISVFVELNSKVVSEGIGFPELLLDRSLSKPLRYKHLSYAKYNQDTLVNHSGDYVYNYKLNHLKETNNEFQLMSEEGYNHLVYSPEKRNHIIVSNRSLSFTDYLISFPYIFVFYFVFILMISIVGNPNYRKLVIPRDLKFRIQVSIISVVLGSLILVATGTLYYNIQEYRNRHQSDLKDRMSSVSEEIKIRLLNVKFITPELQQWLDNELFKLSNVFRTDINIYDLKGRLLVTSRPEIYSKGVISGQMNSEAFCQLSALSQLNYFQPEKIGSLSYLSAYEPIINSSGNIIGYLNLPYFTREDELKQSISTFIVAFINLYLILFLTSVIVAILLSNRITQPLSLIREKLRGIQLGKKNERINYMAQDEIGALVSEYNHKVEELAESADLLARSERESAWREMAKQVAHEIKNPLTPMKLNIQYLQKAKEDGNEKYDEFFNRVTRNLIEQIDTLSAIATEFSSFAQIQEPRNEVFNLPEIIQNVISLFEPSPNLVLSFEKNQLSELMVFADREQFSRALLNLIKNAIQASPADQIAEIRIEVQSLGLMALISINDNGTGISEEVQANLFQPNFTTKTSGMGLGLSIVKNIVENFGGKIWFTTATDHGTTFFIEIPVFSGEAEPLQKKGI